MKKEIIELYQSSDDSVNESIDRIVVQVHNYKKALNKNTILMTGCSPRAGVTMTSINLGIALAASGWRTLIVDADLKKGNSYKKNGHEVECGLSEHLMLQKKGDEIIRQTNHDNLEFVCCGNPMSNSVRLLASVDMEKFIESVKNIYDYIIIDTPSVNVVPDASILFPTVDGIILMAALVKTTKRQLRDARRQVSKYSEKYYGLVVNEVDDKQYKEYFEDHDYFRENVLEKKFRKDIRKTKNNRRLHDHAK